MGLHFLLWRMELSLCQQPNGATMIVFFLRYAAHGCKSSNALHDHERILPRTNQPARVTPRSQTAFPLFRFKKLWRQRRVHACQLLTDLWIKTWRADSELGATPAERSYPPCTEHQPLSQ